MFFSKIDSKNNCKSIYADDKVFSDYDEGMKYTWTYQEDLPQDVKFVKLFCGGKDYLELLPKRDAEEYKSLESKIKNTLILLSHTACVDMTLVDIVWMSWSARPLLKIFSISRIKRWNLQ
jgi:hypothetical protein